MALKPDAEDIQDYMRGLAASLRLESSRRWWTQWLFRSDHVENTAAILNSGKLLSREAAESKHLIVKDSGKPDLIRQLTPEQRRYVRLYFRPRTPTQYANEGIRPKDKIEYEAHMPVPVYLLFSTSLLMEEGGLFTHGRFTESAKIGATANFLRGINFSDVYHDSAVGRWGAADDRRSRILNSRHSEVLVKDELALDHVKHIVCRSAPERDTLLNLLVPNVRARWVKRIHVDEGRRRLFYKRGTFVQDANLSRTESHFVFYSNIESNMRGPFELQIEWILDGHPAKHINPKFMVTTSPCEFKLGDPSLQYRVRVTLNGDLAYLGEFDADLASDMVF